MLARPSAPRRPLRLLPAAAVLLCLSAPVTASAEGAGIGIFVDAFTVIGDVDEHTLDVAPVVTEPDPLKDRGLLLDGPGSFHGGGLHLAILGSAVRGGFGVGVYGMEGMKLRHDPLPEGLTASIETTWGASFDVFLGRELVGGPVYPYVDLRAVLDVMQAGVVLRHPEYGVLGETAYNAFAFGLGPRLGVSVPLCDPWVIDLSWYHGLFGAERMTIVASVGLWDR